VAETDEEKRARLRGEVKEAFGDSPKSGREPPPEFLITGIATQAIGLPGGRVPSMTLEQVAAGYENESIDQRAPRNETHRSIGVTPGWGRTPLPVDRHPRTLTEFLYVPIDWTDEKTAFKIEGDPGHEHLVEVKILQPKHLSSIPRGRSWTLWAKGGPLCPVRTHEGRVEVRRTFRHFIPRNDYNYSLVRDAWEPTAKEQYWAVNPELQGLELHQIRDIFRAGPTDPRFSRSFSQWRMMDETEQRSWFNYLEALTITGCHQDPRGFNPHNSQIDFHMNRDYGVVANAVRNMELGPTGIPIYQQIGNESAYYEPKLLEASPDLTEEQKDQVDAARFGPLINSNQQAEELYKLNKGYGRVDFDPRCYTYRDLWGCYYPTRDPWREIISDTERMAETFHPAPRRIEPEAIEEKKQTWTERLLSALFFFRRTRKKPPDEGEGTIKNAGPYLQWCVIGPSHSVVDLCVERPAESLVLEGKAQRSKKLASHQDRLWNTGEVTFSYIETDTSGWWGSHAPQMARWMLVDARSFLPYFTFWRNFIDSDRDVPIGDLLSCNVSFDDFKKLVAKAPRPTDFWERVNLWHYFKFDPAASQWGYDPDGTPRLPVDLIRRLAYKPELGGLNMSTHEGPRVLEIYRNQPGVAEAIRGYWLRKVDPDKRSQRWQELIDKYGDDQVSGEDYLTMGYVFWRPMEETGNYHKGFLYELWRNQPAEPFDQRLLEERKEAELNRITNILHVVRLKSEGFPSTLHGRPDMEKVVNKHRREAILWMIDRAAEHTYLLDSRSFMPPLFSGWVRDDGFPARVGDNTWSQTTYMMTGYQSWLNPVYDKKWGKAEAEEDFSWSHEEDMQWRRQMLLTRGTNLWHATGKTPTEGINQGQAMVETKINWISEWVHAYGGLGTDPEPALELSRLIYTLHWEDWWFVEEILESFYTHVSEEEKEERIRAIKAVFFTSKNMLLPR